MRSAIVCSRTLYRQVPVNYHHIKQKEDDVCCCHHASTLQNRYIQGQHQSIQLMSAHGARRLTVIYAACAFLFILLALVPVFSQRSLLFNSDAFCKSTVGSSMMAVADNEFDTYRPPLFDLIGDAFRNITGDVQFLLDFAILGHAKTATTAMLSWLADHPEVMMYRNELLSLARDRPAELVALLYALPPGNRYKRGYKAVFDIRKPGVMFWLGQYWPKTKLIVGLRHPIEWFESHYNYHVRMNNTIAPVANLIGECKGNSRGVCTDGTLFHFHLSLMGKTLEKAPEELKLLEGREERGLVRIDESSRIPNQVFLYEINQFGDPNAAREKRFRNDLQAFLGLREPLPAQAMESANTHEPLNICLEEHKRIRQLLLQNARDAARWILKYFLQSSDVVVSDPEYFRTLLLKWMKDPCEGRRELPALGT